MVRAAPVAVDDVYTVAHNTSRTVLAPGVLSNDTGFPPPTATLLSGTTTAGGTVIMNLNGGFNYVPPAGFSGTDTFVYSAVNSAGSDSATVTLTVASSALAQNDASFTSAGTVAGSSAAQSFTPTPQAGTVSVNVGSIPAGKKVTIVFDVAIANPLPVGVDQLSNQGSVSASGVTAVLTDDPHKPGAADPTITSIGVRKIYLATIMHRAGDGPPLPDLVVSSITASGGNLQVTIRNIGQAPAVDAFWVDAYINPTAAPVRVNQLWNNLGARGAMWGVSNNALPLVPGETLTLTLNDSYYRPEQSNPGGPIVAGTQLYAQVDSFNSNGNSGAVRESHERDGGAYNNILGPVVAP
jgi:hypothetical protein